MILIQHFQNLKQTIRLKRSFKYSGTMLWNSLPSEAKKASSLYQFKRSMSTTPET
jgi:hypothetical protein